MKTAARGMTQDSEGQKSKPKRRGVLEAEASQLKRGRAVSSLSQFAGGRLDTFKDKIPHPCINN